MEHGAETGGKLRWLERELSDKGAIFVLIVGVDGVVRNKKVVSIPKAFLRAFLEASTG